MSRIGKMPIAVPAGVTVEIAENNKVTVKGPKGTLERVLPAEMEIKLEGAEITVSRPNDLKKMRSLHGLTRTLINNMVVGVTNGYEKVLEVNGVGYKAQKNGKTLVLSLGYSHPVEMVDPEGLETVLDGQNKITVKGIDKAIKISAKMSVRKGAVKVELEVTGGEDIDPSALSALKISVRVPERVLRKAGLSGKTATASTGTVTDNLAGGIIISNIEELTIIIQ